MILQKLVDAAVGNVAKLQYTEMQCDVWWSLDLGKQSLNPMSHCNTSINDKSAKSKRKIPGHTDANKSQQSLKEKIPGHTLFLVGTMER